MKWFLQQEEHMVMKDNKNKPIFWLNSFIKDNKENEMKRFIFSICTYQVKHTETYQGQFRYSHN